MARVQHLLIVDRDEADALEIERCLLEANLTLQCRRVCTFREFVVAMEFNPTDLILAEFDLKEFDVVEALQYLEDKNCKVPLVVVTRNETKAAVVDCFKAGARDFVSKACLYRLPAAVGNVLERTRAERERDASEAQYRVITESARDLICLVDRHFNVLYASPSFQRALQHSPLALEGIPFMSLVHPDDLVLLERSLEDALYFRESRNVEIRICHANGSWQVFEATTTYVFTRSDQPDRALIMARDMSDRKQAEREIHKLAAFPRFNPNPVIEFAGDGSLTYFNDAAMRMARHLKRPHPHMILPLNSPMIVKRCLSTGKCQDDVKTVLNGRCIHWSFIPVLGNQVVHCYAVDLTESLNLEAQLRQAQKMDSIGQLAAGVAHDFNNILTVIQGHSSLMQSLPGIDDILLQSARQITIAAERASGLTRQLLLFSRKQTLQPQLLDLSQVIFSIAKMLRALVGERIRIKFETARDLPSVHADPGMMEQVLVNMVVNARDAMEQGGEITLRTAFLETDPQFLKEHASARPGKFVRLSIQDTGHGMEEETMHHIFEPFFTTKGVGKGTGLGLATVNAIVTQHAGWIEVRSSPSRGTTFDVFLPITTKAPLQSEKGGPTTVMGGHETILVVEDEASLRDLIRELLEKRGYRVFHVTNGSDALKVWRERREEIDMLLTDMMLPEGIMGRELAERMSEERPDLRILYTSGYSLDVVHPGFVSTPRRQFLQKPYPPELLLRAVRDCLDGKMPESADGGASPIPMEEHELELCTPSE